MVFCLFVGDCFWMFELNFCVYSQLCPVILNEKNKKNFKTVFKIYSVDFQAVTKVKLFSCWKNDHTMVLERTLKFGLKNICICESFF